MSKAYVAIIFVTGLMRSQGSAAVKKVLSGGTQSNIPYVPQTDYEKNKKKWDTRAFSLIKAFFYAAHFKCQWTYALPKERCRNFLFP